MSKILIIDDEPSMHTVIERILRGKGFEVINAMDGLAGVKLARTARPDLVLCDINMGQVDGYTAVTVLRLHPDTANIPLILMTGNANLEGMRRGMSLGADDYLTKPFDADTLVAAVKLRLQKRQEIRAETDRKLAELRTNITTMLPHELLTPLNGILGLADLIVDEARNLPLEEVVELARGIRQSGKRLEHLINNFLIYAQIELLAAEPARVTALRETSSVELAGALEGRARKTADTWKRGGDLMLDVRPVRVAVTEENLNTILAELLDNAFKFSTAGTTVRVSTTVQNGEVFVVIGDLGRGMKTEQLDNFGAFVQFERRLYEQQGAGLGLVIARRLTEIHGGRLQITSDAGQGTAVQLTLPVSAGTTPDGK